MDLVEILARWRKMAGQPPAEPYSEGDDGDNDDYYGIFAFFQTFRPDGVGLEQALLPLPNGKAVLDRLIPIYAATKTGWQNDESSDGYFVVRNPPTIEPDDAETLVRRYLTRIREIAELAGADELPDLLRAPTLSISREAPPESPDRHDTDLVIYDTLCDWVGSLQSDPHELAELGDAFYSIACDYPLAWYAMWPWFAGATSIDDPFLPYFHLWRHGVEYRFDGPSSAIVYVP